ncbi:MAG: family 10 glycosylhydrolase [Oscillospiraceae bacterium]|jgi:uncharacterized lipoprotein YddW (UPF0748 family)|nr:family 10 glycosylhydrolase [Oscillospiraceae bacterium]
MMYRRIATPVLLLLAALLLLSVVTPTHATPEDDVHTVDAPMDVPVPRETLAPTTIPVPSTTPTTDSAVLGTAATVSSSASTQPTQTPSTLLPTTMPVPTKQVTICPAAPPTKSVAATTQTPKPLKSSNALRGVWINYMEVPKATGTKSAYQKAADSMFAALQKDGYNAVFVQVRPFADAIYPSKYFPWSKYLTGTQGKDPGFDPMKVLVDSAHAHGLKFHAWLNPFRVLSSSQDETTLAENHPARVWLRDAATAGLVVKTAGGIYFNPASPTVHRLVNDGVREILENYAVDGIHIDDYFYPAQNVNIDKTLFDAYQKDGGQLPLADWRRAKINAFVAGLYSTVKNVKPGAVFSISPGGNIRHNREQLYADAAVWAQNPGYVDLLIPQIYFGFENQTMPFARVAEEWNNMVTAPGVQLAIGLAAYKSGRTDSGAGTGAAEWTQYNDILARQAALAQQLRPGVGLVLYSYGYLHGDRHTDADAAELKKLYQGKIW